MMRRSTRSLLIAALGLASTSLSAQAIAACPVAAFNGTQLCNAESNALIQKAAAGDLGSAGPAIGTINDGCGKPKVKTPVPFQMPCVLAKSVGLVESRWKQFDAATCGTKGPTVISFDCGYGVMQVTSGMSGGAGFDPTRVANETAYNVGTGMLIMASKWRATPCVGDNEPAVMEDWYYATWAYNGFCWCNNPNNTNFAWPRPPYNGPGTLARAKYPYQEIVWGIVQYPYAGTYEGQAISYPSRASITNPPSAIPAPTPTHSGSCAPVVVAKPDMYPSVAIEAISDRFADGSSQGKPDAVEGQAFAAQLYLKNQGTAVAANVEVGVWIEEPHLTAHDYTIGSDYGHPGVFSTNDANDNPDNPAHAAQLSKSFTLGLYSISPGETKRITLDMIAEQYSIGAVDHPDVRFWVKSVTGFYQQDAFDAAPTTSDGQTFGSKVQAYGEMDVYSATRWEWDGDLLEGWTASSGAAVSVDAGEKALLLTTNGSDPATLGPTTSFPAASYPGVELRAKRAGGTGPGRVYYTTDADPAFDEVKSAALDIPDDGDYHTVIVPLTGPSWQGQITQIRVDPYESGKGEVRIDYLRATGSAPLGDPPLPSGAGGGGEGGNLPGAGGDGVSAGGSGSSSDSGASGCSCGVAGSPATGSHAGWALVSLGLAVALRSRGRRRSTNN